MTTTNIRLEFGARHGTCEHWGCWPTADSLSVWLRADHSDWEPIVRFAVPGSPIGADSTVETEYAVQVMNGRGEVLYTTSPVYGRQAAVERAKEIFTADEKRIVRRRIQAGPWIPMGDA